MRTGKCISALFAFTAVAVMSYPVKFPQPENNNHPLEDKSYDSRTVQVSPESTSFHRLQSTPYEGRAARKPHAADYQRQVAEGRRFHQHAIKKRRKKKLKRKLLQCLLGGVGGRSANGPAAQGRTLFLLNYYNVDIDSNGGGGHGGGGEGGLLDESPGGGCGNLLGGGHNGGDDGDDGDDDDGDDDDGDDGGDSPLSSLVGQVGQLPGNLLGSVGDNIRPVFENPERYLQRYVFTPLYRSFRPLYRLF